MLQSDFSSQQNKENFTLFWLGHIMHISMLFTLIACLIMGHYALDFSDLTWSKLAATSVISLFLMIPIGLACLFLALAFVPVMMLFDFLLMLYQKKTGHCDLDAQANYGFSMEMGASLTLFLLLFGYWVLG
ncbi:Uncharacterised protein [Canicola haemoglobinophilus]|uniref:Uncharacterized protein n=1 Tax=Canicola haemoglobinophilus TaxID=733 RepID=A0AB38H9V2_9PAST|nr:hypothetical protein [Canicola haemoglobinophilus]STO54362.1 Uncharacterised protein [Canicola haemoglobinophilus]STO68896.1 Uncharacterised protein [Canicola haemoglobinophilus]